MLDVSDNVVPLFILLLGQERLLRESYTTYYCRYALRTFRPKTEQAVNKIVENLIVYSFFHGIRNF